MMRWVGAAAAAVLAVTGFAGQAQAAPVVTCGSYLEEDAFLTQDLRCDRGIDLALDVTLDLRGHRLIGPGPTKSGAVGVRLSPAWPSKVVNGTITGWPIAVGGNEDFETVESATLENLRITNSGTAIAANQAALTVTDSVFRNNGTAVESLSYGDRGTSLTVTGSTFTGNGVGVHADPVGEPVAGYSTVLTGNVFRDNGDAVYVTTPGTALGGNTARRNTGWGIYAPGATDLGGNRARRNGNQPQCVGVRC